MEDITGQPIAGGSATGNQDQNKVNPMSPNFMGSAGGSTPPSSPFPSNPPMGGSQPLPPPPPSAVGTPPSTSGPMPVSPPPPKEVDIRTMASDQESLKATGGIGVSPAMTNPSFGKKVDSAGQPGGKSSGNKKALLIGVLIVIILGALSAAAYVFVWPTLFGGTSETEEIVGNEPVVEISKPIIPSFTYESFLKEPVDGQTKVIASKGDLAEIKQAMVSVASDVIANENTLEEFYVSIGDNPNPMTAEEFVGETLPDLLLVAPLEKWFTGFFYNDGQRVWSGYIFALDSDVEDKDLIKKILGEDIEASAQLSNLFLEDPGEPSKDTFSDGSSVGEITSVRYLAFSDEGASINYGWKGDRLVISTSFAGLKAVANNIGEPVVEEEVATTTEETI